MIIDPQSPPPPASFTIAEATGPGRPFIFIGPDLFGKRARAVYKAPGPSVREDAAGGVTVSLEVPEWAAFLQAAKEDWTESLSLARRVAPLYCGGGKVAYAPKRLLADDPHGVFVAACAPPGPAGAPHPAHSRVGLIVRRSIEGGTTLDGTGRPQQRAHHGDALRLRPGDREVQAEVGPFSGGRVRNLRGRADRRAERGGPPRGRLQLVLCPAEGRGGAPPVKGEVSAPPRRTTTHCASR